MNRNKALFTSISVEWPTPAKLYAALDAEFAFTLDPCPVGADRDGLSPLYTKWGGQNVYCNPPYGKTIGQWIARHSEANLAVYLLPARTDTKWFHDLVLPAAEEIRFLRGRLYYGDCAGRAPFPSMIVVFRPKGD